MNIQLSKELSIAFKGERDYVYASDVFMEVYQILKNHFPTGRLENIDFSSHKMARNQVRLTLYDTQQKELSDMQSMFNFTHNNQEFFGLITETNKLITARTEYDEKNLFNEFEMDVLNKTVLFSKSSEYSVLDIFTSLNKYMLTNLFPSVKQGWLSVRTKMDHFPESEYKELKVVFRKDFAGKYFQSNLFYNSQQIGQIYFSPKQ